MSFHVALLWALFWISGLGPLLVMLYIPIGLAWIVGYGLYLGFKRLTSTMPSPDRQPPNSICKFCARRVFEPCQSIEQAQTACTLSRPNRPGAA